MNNLVSFHPVSECALLIEFNLPDSTELSVFIGQVTQQVYHQLEHSVMNVTPSYTTILIDYLPHRMSQTQLIAKLDLVIEQVDSAPIKTFANSMIELPVYYHPEVAPDLERFQAMGIDIDAFIEFHTTAIYTVQATGFAPGFAFMGDVVTDIQLPRHDTPRLKVPRGSVAIAENKTAVYPCESPGGWNIIGNCPIDLYHPENSPMIPFIIGGQVRFVAINRERFIQLGGQFSEAES
ncbi:5-oxoprolinase subunit B family protein [Vibrio renipiscarius]|uniref:Allophanate hydrolase n=1 Tax=Vibrio renipiscarius TaxID=1461322 RepID=A0A0C2NHQ4_9VIBR|nr:allophanate hydrolase subunit 1 [Vibrio renipiscarius]KII75977.1 allophanate hydrolase [Vibrio renipiscarius]KII79081.1 allophanate hydrolase [Vibrio renipiscarius]